MNFAKGTSSSGAESHPSWSHTPSQLCVYACKKITYVKDPAVHGRVWWIMETPKQPSMHYNVRVFIMLKLDSIQKKKKKNFNITDPSDLAWAVASSTKWRQCYITVTSSMLALRLMQKVVSVSCSTSSVKLSILIQILNSQCQYRPVTVPCDGI